MLEEETPCPQVPPSVSYLGFPPWWSVTRKLNRPFSSQVAFGQYFITKIQMNNDSFPAVYCGGLNEKCSPESQAVKHTGPSWYCCLGRFGCFLARLRMALVVGFGNASFAYSWFTLSPSCLRFKKWTFSFLFHLTSLLLATCCHAVPILWNLTLWNCKPK